MTPFSANKNKLLLFLVLAVLAGGVATSVDLTYIHFKVASSDGSYKSFCNINETINCDAVAQSEFSTFFGIPIAILGMATYLFSMLIVSLRISRFRDRIPRLDALQLWIAAGSVGYSLFLAYICFAIIHAWCIMCMVLYLVNFLFLALSIPLSETPTKDQFRAFREILAWMFGTKLKAALFILLGLAALTTFTLGGIRDYQAEQERLEKLLSRLTPVSQTFSDVGSISGNLNASKTLVVFTDYQCPYCMKLELTLDELLAKRPDLRLIRKDFPLDMACNPLITEPFHNASCLSATYALCAARQGKYKEFHHHLLANQRKIEENFLNESVRELGLDENAMRVCVESPDVAAELKKSIDEGLALKLRGTPALVFPGNRMMKGALKLKELEKILDAIGNE